jgi:pimeloyl-ACP methyl ester carboxylesterase
MELLRRGEGDPILFVHGIPTSNQLWRGVVDRLLDNFTCYTLDLPGLGRTPRSPCGIGQLRKMAEEIDRLRERAGIERWHVVGHDAGSAIAVFYASLYADRTNCLSLLSPALFPELRPYYLFELLRKPLLGEVLAPCLNPIIWRTAMRRACLGEDGARCVALSDFRAPFAGVRGSWHMMRVLRWGNPSEVLADIPSLLPQLRVPTLIFQGARDPAIPRVFATRARGLIPNARLLMVDAGHFIPLNRPGIVAQSLAQFFGAQAARKASAC